MPEEQNYVANPQMDFLVKLRDVEDRQKILRDRVLLIGKNLIDSREEIGEDLTQLKIDVSKIKEDLIKIKEVLSSISEELSNTSRRSEVAILEKQFKMFSPLEFARIEDVEKMLKQKGK